MSPVCSGLNVLTHLVVAHICVSEMGPHWFRKWLVVSSAPSHYLNQCWFIVDWTPGNKFQSNSSRNSIIFIQENASQIVVCQNGGHFVQVRWVNIINCSGERTGCEINNPGGPLSDYELTHLPLDKMATISQTIFSDAFHFRERKFRILNKISLKFVPNGLINDIPSLVQIMVFWIKFYWSLLLMV